MKKLFQTAIAYIFHAVFIIMSFILMPGDCNILQTAFLVTGLLYLIYWIVYNRKGYMPWIVYLHFLIGAAAQLMLNLFGVIPEDGGYFAGLGQFFYIVIVVIHAVLLGAANLILYVIDRKRSSSAFQKYMQ